MVVQLSIMVSMGITKLYVYLLFIARCNVVATFIVVVYTIESVDSICRDGADTPIKP